MVFGKKLSSSIFIYLEAKCKAFNLKSLSNLLSMYVEGIILNHKMLQNVTKQEFLDPLVTWSRKITCQSKTIISPLSQCL